MRQLKKGILIVINAARNLLTSTVPREMLLDSVSRNVPRSCSEEIASKVNRIATKLNAMEIISPQSTFV